MSAVLILDDNVYKLALIKGWVEDAGHADIKTCLTYQDAQSAFKDKKFEYMLIDYHLGAGEKLTGKDFVKDCLHDGNFKHIIYSGEKALAPEEDREDIVDIVDLRYEISKKFAFKRKVKSDTEERFLYQKIYSVSETVARHEEAIKNHSSKFDFVFEMVGKLDNKMDDILCKIAPLVNFASKNDKAADQIKLFLIIIGSIVTIFMSFNQLKVWFK